MRLEIKVRYFWSADIIRPWKRPGGCMQIVIEPVKEKGTTEGRAEPLQTVSKIILQITNLYETGEQIEVHLQAGAGQTVICHSVDIPENKISPTEIAERTKIRASLFEEDDMTKEIISTDTVSPSLVPALSGKVYWSNASWAFGAVILSISIAFLGCNITMESNDLVTINNIAWLKSAGVLAQLAYVILVVALVAGIMERILEAVVAASRKPSRILLETLVEHAERAWKVDRKNITQRNILLSAELDLQSFRSQTRVRTLAAGFVFGSIFGVFADFPLTEAIGQSNGIARFFEILLIGILVAGGSEPLHDLLKGLRAGVKKVAGIRSVK
jgi:hypothetical protein